MADNTAYDYEDSYEGYESYDGSDSDYENVEYNRSDVSSEEEKFVIRRRNTEARTGSVIKMIMVTALAAALLGSVIYTLNKRNTMYNKVASLSNELGLVETENIRLQSELESKMSAKNVEEYAENVLGMQKIDSSQIKYIKIQTGDVVNIPEQEKGFIAKIKGLFDKCVEYFRG